MFSRFSAKADVAGTAAEHLGFRLIDVLCIKVKWMNGNGNRIEIVSSRSSSPL